MSKVVRYFHIRPIKQGRGGATVKVTGSVDQIGQVDIQTVFCSKKDMFCKKTGRSLAETAPIKVVALRYLPQELARIQDAMERKIKWPSYGHDFTYALKYFLPKE